MKKYLVLLFSMFFLFQLGLNAQDVKREKNANQGLEKRVEKMATDLSLNAAEAAKLKVVLEKQASEMKTIRDAAEPGSDEFKAKMKELRNSQEEELKTVLGAEKYEKMKEIRAAERANAPKKNN